MQSYTFDATQKRCTDSSYAKSLYKVMQRLRPAYVGEKSDAKLYHDSLAIVLQKEKEGQPNDSLEDNKQKQLKEQETQQEKIVWNTYAGLLQFHRMQTISEDEIY